MMVAYKYYVDTNFNSYASYEAQLTRSSDSKSLTLFQLMSLIRGATADIEHHMVISTISIHAPHTRRNPFVCYTANLAEFQFMRLA